MKSVNHNEIRIETLPSMFMAKRKTISTAPEMDGGEFMDKWMDRRGLDRSATRYFGFDIDIPAEDSQAGKRGYEHWRIVPEGTQPDDGVEIGTFSGGLYAAMTLLKPFEDAFFQIPNGWKLLHEWVIGNAHYQGGPHQWLEELLFRENGDDLKLYIPVMPKKVPNLIKSGQV